VLTRNKPLIFMLGPRRPLTGGMVSVMDNLCASSLSARFDIRPFQTGKTTPAGRPLAAGVGAQLSLAWRLARELPRQRPAIVHLHTCSGRTFWRDSAHMLIARLCGANGVWHIHGGGFDKFIRSLGPIGRRVVARSLRLAKAIIVLNEEMLGHRALAPGALWQVVVNGVSVCQDPDVAGRRGQPGRATSFLFMGNLNPAKGAWDLVRAAGQATARKCDLRVQIAGPPTANAPKEGLLKLAGDCGCGDCVEFLGVIGGQEKANALAQADVLALPSYCEAMPMAILEGMAAGLPVIATTVGAIGQVVRDGVEGFLVPPGDIEALAGKMVQMARDADLRRRMGEAARKRVAAKYSLEAMARPIEQMYMQIIDSGASR
jgi:glycosyltransferase involved in cell wall biosynthesis